MLADLYSVNIHKLISETIQGAVLSYSEWANPEKTLTLLGMTVCELLQMMAVKKT